MKRSENVITVLACAGIAASVLHHGPVYRDEYPTREECQADWGKTDPSRCEERSFSGGGSRFLGPSYERGGRPEGVVNHAVSQMRVARGGFGASGAHFSARGS